MTPDIFFTDAPPTKDGKRTWFVHTSVQIPDEVVGKETVTRIPTPQVDEFGIVRPIRMLDRRVRIIKSS